MSRAFLGKYMQERSAPGAEARERTAREMDDYFASGEPEPVVETRAENLPPSDDTPTAATTPIAEGEASWPEYQREGRAHLGGYLQDPGKQFWEAPLGGWGRAGLENVGADPEVAAWGERGLAGLLAAGVGIPTMMAAVDALMGQTQTPETLPMQPAVSGLPEGI